MVRQNHLKPLSPYLEERMRAGCGKLIDRGYEIGLASWLANNIPSPSRTLLFGGCAVRMPSPGKGWGLRDAAAVVLLSEFAQSTAKGPDFVIYSLRHAMLTKLGNLVLMGSRLCESQVIAALWFLALRSPTPEAAERAILRFEGMAEVESQPESDCGPLQTPLH